MKNMIQYSVLCCAMLFVGFSGQVMAGEIAGALRAALNGAGAGDEIAVIITFKEQLNVRSYLSAASQRGLRSKYLQRHSLNTALRARAEAVQKLFRPFLQLKKARNIIPFWIFNGMALTLRADLVEELAKRPEISSVQLDGTVSMPEPSPALLAGTAEWNIDAVKAPMLWTIGHTGQGIVVANVDTGVDALHQDLAVNYRGGSNSWYDPHGQHATPYDYHGHGTQTMSVMVGGDAGGTTIGMAPDARWIAVKMFDDAGNASYSAIHLSYQWLLDPDGDPATDDLPDVVNSSWGFEQNPGECITDFQPDIAALKAAGVAMVFSAGNQGPGGLTSVSPGNYADSFAVGSVDNLLDISLTSSRGASGCDGSVYPELVAPGEAIRTADLTSGGVFPASYAVSNGTSFAAPHVAGAMALLLSADSQLTVSELESVLVQSAIDLGTAGWDNDYGKGLVNVNAANNLLPMADTNNNGIEDGWEMFHFDDLLTATATSDFDNDHYTDLQEYLNWRLEISDPLGQPFDPKNTNAPGGTGYHKSNIFLLTLPAILHAASQPIP